MAIKKKVTILVALGAVIVIGGYLLGGGTLERLKFTGTLFSGAEQYESFARVKEFMPVSKMTAAPVATALPLDLSKGKLPKDFEYDGQRVLTETFLAETDTSALIIVKNGEVVFEEYWLSGGQQVNWLSMSVAKSFISTAIGIAVDDGLIDINKPVTFYLPSLNGSAYEGVKIKDVLQMSSGAAWNEDYTDPNSDVNRMGQSLAFGNPLEDFIKDMDREFEPGTVNRYNSADTQVLGMLLTAATGQPIYQYMQDKLWHPLGMESNAYWIIDDSGMEMAFGGLNATARDYAKLGELMLRKGQWNGVQIVSDSWVDQATQPDAPHIQPGVNAEFPLGYGYQWWIPETQEGEYLAIGVYNQFIYVNPAHNLVVVKLSAYSDYATSNDESAYREIESIEFFRAINA
ncbi:MAG: serine hydrolase, partial [Pseudomonadota bacterium]